MLVSVLLPFKNAAATLEAAVASVLDQRGVDVDVELVAIDDGSTDGGAALLPRAGVTRVDTGGVGIARALTAGLAAARGAIVARMDADDVSLPGRFAAQLDALRAAPRVAALGTCVAITPAGAAGEGMRRYVAWQNALTTPDDHARELFVEAPLCHPSVMLRREALAEVGGWRDGPFPEDYDLWLRLDAAGWQLAKLPGVYLEWRHQPGRATFCDLRYALARFPEAKAPFLARKLSARGRPVAIWGAGPTGKRQARALEACGVRAERFVDIDPRKIGRVARGAPIVAPPSLARGAHTVVVAVGARGARALIRERLAAGGFVEGDDYFCAA